MALMAGNGNSVTLVSRRAKLQGRWNSVQITYAGLPYLNDISVIAGGEIHVSVHQFFPLFFPLSFQLEYEHELAAHLQQ